MTTIERFFAKVDKSSPNGCWLWTAYKDRDGYGDFQHKRAHRFSWELVNGPIPAGLQIDHLCRVRSCVNPLHLEPVTGLVNTRRGNVAEVARARGASMTHCYRGHEFTDDNVIRQGPGKKYRTCRLCRKRSLRIYHGRTKQTKEES